MIAISGDLNCTLNNIGDTESEFYHGDACGTLVSTGGALFGPLDIPAGQAAAPRTAFTPMSQTLSGVGSSADPVVIHTVVALAGTNLQIAEDDSYVNGDDFYRTDVQIQNLGTADESVVLYRAFDCYLHNSDFGFGHVNVSTGGVRCQTFGTSPTPILEHRPISTGSSYFEGYYNDMWLAIATKASLPNTCVCLAENHDNGAALSWSFSIPAGSSVTRSEQIFNVLSGVQFVPPEQTYGASSGSIWAMNPSIFRSDPVNTATGSFTHYANDLELPGPGPAFRLTRYYTSQDPGQGPLGVSWTHSYAAQLIFQSNGDGLLRAEDGQQLLFAIQSDGSFKEPSGSLGTLAAVAGGYDLTRRDQLKYHFDSTGRLTEIRDRSSNALALSYGGDGLLASVTDSAGRAVTFTNAGGRLTRVALPDGREVDYGYSSGRLTSATDVRGKTTTYTYDTAGRLETIVDPNGHTEVRNVYDVDGRVVEQYDAFDNKTTFAWNSTTQTSTMTDAAQNQWVDVYSGNILRTAREPSGSTALGWDGDIRLQTIVDPRGNEFETIHDARGNVLTRTAPAPLSYVERWTYDLANNVTSYTDGLGNASTYAYDSSGRLVKETKPGNVVRSWTYKPNGLVDTATDARLGVTRFGYDSSGNLTSVETPLGNRTTYAYDAAGRVLTKVDPRGNVLGANPADYTTSYTYDAAGHVLTETDQLGRVTTSTYDAAGNLKTIKNPDNKTTTYGYNDANELISEEAPDLSTTLYEYDSRGSLTAKTEPESRVTTYTYDAAGRAATMVTPRGNVSGADPAQFRWSYGYDANGNQTTVTDPTGGQTVNGYDVLNRRVSGRNPRSFTTSYEYDANGNQTKITDALTGETINAFDALNRLTSTRNPRGFTTTHEYDANGNRTKTTSAEGVVVRYAYDADDRLVSETRASDPHDLGFGPDGPLVIDGAQYPRSNPYRGADGKSYSTLILLNNGWIAPPAGKSALEIRVSGSLSICSGCGVDVSGIGGAGGAGAPQTNGNAVAGSGPGPGQPGANGTLNGSGGGGGGHAVAGQAGVGGGAGGSGGGLAGVPYGAADLGDGSGSRIGSGGGGGGRGQAANKKGGNGGNGGGWVHLIARSIDVQGQIIADGTAGTAGGTGTGGGSGGGGGGSGGAVWVTAENITLATANSITAYGGAGGGGARSGGTGANGRVRLDVDTLAGAGASGNPSWALVQRPFAAPDGNLTIDGATYPRSNPYRLAGGKRFNNLTLENHGWIAPAAGQSNLEFYVAGILNVCTDCGIDMTGVGGAGGPGQAQGGGGSQGSAGTGPGPGGPGLAGTVNGGGGGGGGHAQAGSAGAGGGVGSGAGGTGGSAYGVQDLTDAAAMGIGSGGAGGGHSSLQSGGAGGVGGGFLHIIGGSITLEGNGQIVADGRPGLAGSGAAGGGGGGGSGGTVWLSARAISLNSTNAISTLGGTGGSGNKVGGNGAKGRVRLDADVLSGAGAIAETSWGSINNQRVSRILTYAYDAAGNRTAETDGIGNTTTLTFDRVGDLASRRDALGHVTSYAYDELNRLNRVTAPDNTLTRYTYDSVGNLKTRIDAKNRITTYEYDGARRRTSLLTPANQRWTYAYDANGNQVSMVDAAGNATPLVLRLLSS